MNTFTLRELLSWVAPPTFCYIGTKHEQILVPESKMLIYAEPESWKSMLTLHTTFCLANNEPWFNHPTNRATVLNIQLEAPKAILQDIMIKMSVNRTVPIDGTIIFSNDRNKFDTGYGHADLESAIKYHKPQIVIIDPLYKVVSGRLTDEYDIRKFQERIEDLMTKYHVAVILVHHTRKSTYFEGEEVDVGDDAILGSALWKAWFDSILFLKKMDDDPATGVVKVHATFNKVKFSDHVIKGMNIEIQRKTLEFNLTEEQEFRCGTPIEVLRGRTLTSRDKDRMYTILTYPS